MFFQDADAVSVVQRRRYRPGYLEENIYADGKVGRIQEAHVATLDQLLDAGQLRVPAGGPHDQVQPKADRGLDVGHDGCGGGEVDGGVNAFDGFRSQCRRVFVFRHVEDSDIVALFAGDVCDQRTGFTAAEDDEFHRVHFVLV